MERPCLLSCSCGHPKGRGLGPLWDNTTQTFRRLDILRDTSACAIIQRLAALAPSGSMGNERGREVLPHSGCPAAVSLLLRKYLGSLRSPTCRLSMPSGLRPAHRPRTTQKDHREETAREPCDAREQRPTTQPHTAMDNGSHPPLPASDDHSDASRLSRQCASMPGSRISGNAHDSDAQGKTTAKDEIRRRMPDGL